MLLDSFGNDAKMSHVDKIKALTISPWCLRLGAICIAKRHNIFFTCNYHFFPCSVAQESLSFLPSYCFFGLFLTGTTRSGITRLLACLPTLSLPFRRSRIRPRTLHPCMKRCNARRQCRGKFKLCGRQVWIRCILWVVLWVVLWSKVCRVVISFFI